MDDLKDGYGEIKENRTDDLKKKIGLKRKGEERKPNRGRGVNWVRSFMFNATKYLLTNTSSR